MNLSLIEGIFLSFRRVCNNFFSVKYLFQKLPSESTSKKSPSFLHPVIPVLCFQMRFLKETRPRVGSDYGHSPLPWQDDRDLSTKDLTPILHFVQLIKKGLIGCSTE